MVINEPQVANNVGCIREVFKIDGSKNQEGKLCLVRKVSLKNVNQRPILSSFSTNCFQVKNLILFISAK